METIRDGYKLNYKEPAAGSDNSVEDLLETRRLFNTAADALIYSGDKWLSTGMLIEAVKLGHRALRLLEGTDDNVRYENLCHELVLDLIEAESYEAAVGLCEEAMASGMALSEDKICVTVAYKGGAPVKELSDKTRIESVYDAARFWLNGGDLDRVRPAEIKRRERKQRRWQWRNLMNGNVLRRVTAFRANDAAEPVSYRKMVLDKRISERLGGSFGRKMRQREVLQQQRDALEQERKAILGRKD